LKCGLQGIEIKWHCSIVAGGGNVNHLPDFFTVYRTVVTVGLDVVEPPYCLDRFTTIISVSPMMIETDA